MNATFRFAEAADLDRVCRLMRSAVTVARWPDDEYRKRIAEGRVLLANIDRHLVGALVFSGAPPEWEIENIAVDAAVRRQGIARALVRELEMRARERGVTKFNLEVRASNQAAIGLYEKLGFAQTARRRGYYQDPLEDALLFSLALDAGQKNSS